MKDFTHSLKIILAPALAACAVAFTNFPVAGQTPFLPPPAPIVSTVPSNGDVNPYGVFFAPQNMAAGGVLQPGDILVSNFNNAENLQGTGTTIVRVDAHSNVSTFYQAKQGHGLTAALGVLRRGIVLVGSLPTTDGTSNTIQPGSLLVIDKNGQLAGEITNAQFISGPWGMAVSDRGATAQVFYSNVLAGNVVRLDLAVKADGTLTVQNAVIIASGYSHRTDPAALVLGPSGLFYDSARDLLYVANSADNTIYAVPDAGQLQSSNGIGTVIYSDAVHLHGPLDLAMAPNGDLIVANSDGSNVDPNQPSELVEFTADGKFVAQFSVDKNNGGAFGIGLAAGAARGQALRFAAVDDNASNLTIWTNTMR